MPHPAPSLTAAMGLLAFAGMCFVFGPWVTLLVVLLIIAVLACIAAELVQAADASVVCTGPQGLPPTSPPASTSESPSMIQQTTTESIDSALAEAELEKVHALLADDIKPHQHVAVSCQVWHYAQHARDRRKVEYQIAVMPWGAQQCRIFRHTELDMLVVHVLSELRLDAKLLEPKSAPVGELNV